MIYAAEYTCGLHLRAAHCVCRVDCVCTHAPMNISDYRECAGRDWSKVTETEIGYKDVDEHVLGVDRWSQTRSVSDSNLISGVARNVIQINS